MSLNLHFQGETVLTKIIDKSNTRTWVLSLICNILFFTAYYYNFSSGTNGIRNASNPNEPITILNCLYFSITTITTLGYGDYIPLGYGRLFASFEVISGIIIMAIIVSKLASDRTSTLIKLLYTSDNERRLSSFFIAIEECGKGLKNAMLNHDHISKMRYIEELETIVANLNHYYGYQLRVGAIGEGWAKKGSLKVARTIIRAAEFASMAGMEAFATPREQSRIERLMRQIKKTLALLYQEDQPDIFIPINNRIQRIFDHYNKSKINNEQIHYYSEITPELVKSVNNLLPLQPWPKNIHKTIASKLRISNRLCHKIIDSIINPSQAQASTGDVILEADQE
ncbi:potassium channel family protein [Mesoterricola sediminis]|uniref:Potassium channel domain-containing protein n=1 Tax=Mesoterricola sediminis TaxID=2927980 RepID=A0AA48KDK3_9BACT|nr:potassium channel family protein [Mesoterricola sediminis]BDU76417.1 hypothetical protein METESE_13750 [Mesoterricola sediminis]